MKLKTILQLWTRTMKRLEIILQRHTLWRYTKSTAQYTMARYESKIAIIKALYKFISAIIAALYKLKARQVLALYKNKSSKEW